MKSIRDIPLRHQTVFLRVDFNVPLDAHQEITDDGRIKAALPTIEYILSKGAKLVIASHLGRPKGAVVNEMRMKPIAMRLERFLGQEIHYIDDCVGDEVTRMKERLQPGEVMLLENLRFYKEEQENDMHFAEQLAHGIDVYLTDAFGTVHRKHASTFALPSIVFDKGIGFLIQEEMDALDRIINTPKQPLVVVVGGVKISDKVDVIRNLAPMSDTVLVGGGLANTFYAGLGTQVGNSIVESDSVGAGQDAISYVDVAREIAERFASEKPTISTTLPNGDPLSKVQLPVDFIAAESMEEGAQTKIIEIGAADIPENWMFLDIGPKTLALYQEVLGKAKTIFWNGPMGLFEQEAYEHGSHGVARAVADSEGYAVLGGGDTQAVVDKFDLNGRFSHASTGGGASLAYLAQDPLPGLESLE